MCSIRILPCSEMCISSDDSERMKQEVLSKQSTAERLRKVWMKEIIGITSGVLVVISAIPYFVRAYQRKIEPNVTSWSLWSLIGLALLLTYKSSGAEANVWPAIFGFTNPTIIALILIKHRGQWKKPGRVDKLCLVMGVLSLISWVFIHNQKSLVQFALYIAILADAFAAIPTINDVWREPQKDRPFPWAMFAVAYGLGVFAIEERTFSNYVLPIYMFLGASSIALPLLFHRIKNGTLRQEWV